jgi:hypothetical protein
VFFDFFEGSYEPVCIIVTYSKFYKRFVAYYVINAKLIEIGNETIKVKFPKTKEAVT